MKIIETDAYTYHVPEEICFAFNPQRIVIEPNQSSLLRAEFTITSAGKIFTDSRETVDGKINFDISYYLRVLFDFNINRNNLANGENLPATSRPVNVSMKLFDSTNTQVEIQQFDVTAIFGAIGIGEIFNRSRKITCFKNLPFSFSVFAAAGTPVRMRMDNADTWQDFYTIPTTQIYKLFVSYYKKAKKNIIFRFGNGSLNTFNATFSDTFRSEGNTDLLIELEMNECTNGVYLRWLDRHGFYQYYLFSKVSENLKHSNDGDKIAVEYTDSNIFNQSGANYFNGIWQQNKNGTREISLSVPLADKEKIQMLESILTSPLVEVHSQNAVTGQDIFAPVQIVAGSRSANSQPLQDFDITIALPDIISQEL